jgi:hypothetical protein
MWQCAVTDHEVNMASHCIDFCSRFSTQAEPSRVAWTWRKPFSTPKYTIAVRPLLSMFGTRHVATRAGESQKSEQDFNRALAGMRLASFESKQLMQMNVSDDQSDV